MTTTNIELLVLGISSAVAYGTLGNHAAHRIASFFAKLSPRA